MTDTVNDRVRRILLDGAYEAYTGQDERQPGIPIDQRCPGCGVERDWCDRPLCSRVLSEGEE